MQLTINTVFNGSKILNEEFYGAPLIGKTSMPLHKYFSYVQLKNYLQLSGFTHYRFFYPLPEYKFTLNLYSDDYLPKLGELYGHCYTWEYDRLSLVDEETVFYRMVEDGTFKNFVNSYFIIAALNFNNNIDSVQY